MEISDYPIREIRENAGYPLGRTAWPATMAPIAQVLNAGLKLGRATVLVGENGSGKSTLVEAIALAYGLSPEGGSTGAVHTTRVSESPLSEHLELIRNVGATRRGYFLRAETAHGLFSYLEANPSPHGDIAFHEMSHGESFLSITADRFRGSGLWVLDEPESALSFMGCLKLVALLSRLMADGGSQVIMSTHSPVLAALPGANIYELGPWGLHYSSWNDLELVSQWRTFLTRPDRYIET